MIRLEAALRHKLILISAPPGYGKTTLAAQFAHQSPCPVIWHTIEERERDLPNLHAHCVAVWEEVAPGIQELRAAVGHTPDELAGQVTNYLREHISETIIYVLDDVHHLTGYPAAESWLRTLVALCPPNCHLILISRTLPDLPLAEMIARREVLAIGQEELRLTLGEVQTLVRLADPSSHAVDAEALAARLEGWPAGTVLALHPLPFDLEPAMLRGGRGPEALFDVLAGSMLRAQPPRLREFLLASSTLRRLTPELCADALRLPNSSEWLVEVQTRHLFLSRAPDGLYYHTLFRDFLQQQLQETSPELYTSLHIRAARWFEDRGQVDDALNHYLEAGLVERAASIAERVALAFFAQGQVETLLNWAARLSRTGAVVPRLLYTCAMIHTDRYEYDAAEARLNEAAYFFGQLHDPEGEADVYQQQAMLNLQRGRYELAVAQAAQLLDAWCPQSPNLCGRILKVLGMARLRLGQVEEGVRDLEEALPLHRADGDAYTLANVLQDLALAYSRVGRLKDASACLQEVVALRRSLGGAAALALALNNLGCHYHRRSDYEQAQATFQEGLSVIARVPSRRAESYLLWSLGDLERDLGVFDEARRRYDQASEMLGNREPALGCSILISASILERWQGNALQAAELAEQAYKLADRYNILLESVPAQVAWWAAQAQLGAVSEARTQLETLVIRLRQGKIQNDLVHTLSLCAYVALLGGDADAARQHFQAAVDLAYDLGSAQLLAAEVVHTPGLESLAPTSTPVSGLFQADVQKLRAAANTLTRPAQRSYPSVEVQTYGLRVRTLGAESLERDGRLVSPSEWRAASARELFLYLLFEGAQTREQIGLSFWPDSPQKSVRSSFHTTLYRARQALGENVIVFVDGLYRVNPEIDLWCDAQELETLTAQARLLPPRDARTEDLWRRAASLYQGDFLLSVDMDWTFTRREALREDYLDALIGLGECARARRDLKEAIQAFKRALDVDPYREDIHRAILSCYADQGEKRLILEHFHKLKTLLYEDLAVQPSAETLDLAKRLLGTG